MDRSMGSRMYLMSGILLVLVNAADGSNNVDCTQWAQGTDVAVLVDSVVSLSAACNPQLPNTRVTLYCSPGSSVVISGWTMHGGYVSVQGPQATPWSLLNVSVAVVDSVILADRGPAVGVVLAPSLLGQIVFQNVALSSVNATLVSSVTTTTGGGGAAALGLVTVDPASSDNGLRLDNATIIATLSTLTAVSTDGPAAAGGVALSSLYAVTLTNVAVQLNAATSVTANCTSVRRFGVSSAGGVALGSAQSIRIANVSVVLDAALLLSTAESTSLASVSTVGGVSVGRAEQWMSMQAVDLTLRCGGLAQSFTNGSTTQSASIGGVAVGAVNAAAASSGSYYAVITNVTAHVSLCEAMVSSRVAFALSSTAAASTVGGISIAASAYTAVSLMNVTLAMTSSKLGAGPTTLSQDAVINVAECSVNILCTGATNCAASVAGFAEASASATVTLLGLLFTISDSAAVNVSAYATVSPSWAASSVGGVALGTVSTSATVASVVLQLQRAQALAVVAFAGSASAAALGGVGLGVLSAPGGSGLTTRAVVALASRLNRVFCSAQTTGAGGVAATSVAGVAIGLGSNAWCSVEDSVFTVTGPSAIVLESFSQSSNSYCVAGVGGVSVGSLGNAYRATNVTSRLTDCTPTVTSTSSAASTTVVGGHAFGSVTTMTLTDSTAVVSDSTVAVAALSTRYSAASVGGVAVASVSAQGSVLHSTWKLSSCNEKTTVVSVTSSATTAAAATVGGVALGTVGTIFTIVDLTVHVASATSVACVATSTTISSSSVAGVAVGTTNLVIANIETYVSVSNMTAVVAGIANLTCWAVGGNTTASHAAATVGGTAHAAGWQGSSHVVNLTTSVILTTLSCSTFAGISNSHSASGVAGAALGSVDYQFSVTGLVANVSSTVALTTASNVNNDGASGAAAAGIGCGAIGTAATLLITDVDFVIVHSNLSVSSVTATYVGAAAGGEALGAGQVVLRGHFNAKVNGSVVQGCCVGGVGRSAVCLAPYSQGGASATCCRNVTADGGMFPPVIRTDASIWVDSLCAAAQHSTTATTTLEPTGTHTKHCLTSNRTRTRTMAPRRVVSVAPTARPPPSSAPPKRRTPTRATHHPSRTAATRTATATVVAVANVTHPAQQRSPPAPTTAKDPLRAVGIDGATATAVVATAYGSSAVAAAISPTTSNNAVGAARLVKTAACNVFGNFPVPSDSALMPRIPGLLPPDSFGAAAAASMVISTLLLWASVLCTNLVHLDALGR